MFSLTPTVTARTRPSRQVQPRRFGPRSKSSTDGSAGGSVPHVGGGTVGRVGAFGSGGSSCSRMDALGRSRRGPFGDGSSGIFGNRIGPPRFWSERGHRRLRGSVFEKL